MKPAEFRKLRKKMNKTQQQISHLLGVAVRTVRSYEQGWRPIPIHVERQLFFLLAKKTATGKSKPCWVQKRCPERRRETCPAWEFNCGELCWFINGTVCQGNLQTDWNNKMQICRKCVVFKDLLK